MPGSTPGLAMSRYDGLTVEFEVEDETNERFAHIWNTDGRIFGKAKALREAIPSGTWVSVAPNLQPSITWYLVKKVGFRLVMKVPVNGDLDGEFNDVLYKDN